MNVPTYVDNYVKKTQISLVQLYTRAYTTMVVSVYLNNAIHCMGMGMSAPAPSRNKNRCGIHVCHEDLGDACEFRKIVWPRVCQF